MHFFAKLLQENLQKSSPDIILSVAEQGNNPIRGGGCTARSTPDNCIKFHRSRSFLAAAR